MKRGDNSILINPLPETLLTPSDKLFVLGSRNNAMDLLK
jgi:Trk K+ transport system NAD-binding subunit